MNETLKIEKIAYGGEGIGFLADGRVCFVMDALPGETVKVRLIQNKKKFTRARVEEYITTSPSRIKPDCPHVQECGGCQYQHLEYGEEVRWKETQVKEHLSRNLSIDEKIIKPIHPSSLDYGYRNHITLHQHLSNKGKWGFFKTDRRTITPIANCLLAGEPLQDFLKGDRLSLNEARRDLGVWVNSDQEVLTSDRGQLFQVQINGQTINAHTQGFLQCNLEIAGQIGEQIKQWVKAASPDLFMDLYAGVGMFSLLSAGDVKKIVCIEESPQSLKALEQNFKNSSQEVVMAHGKVEDLLPKLLKDMPSQKKFVLLDPPREGLQKSLTGFLSNREDIDDLVYMSCHLGSLVRDLKEILTHQKFEVVSVIPYDMFPRTKHIEILVHLKKKI